MCFDSAHNIGFVANNADNPPFITAISFRTHSIIGKIVFDGTNGTPNATDGIEQCQWNPRDGKIYVTVPEINGPGDNSAPGGISRINPLTLTVEATAVIPLGRLQRTAGIGDRSGGRLLRRDADGLQWCKRQRGGEPSDRARRRRHLRRHIRRLGFAVVAGRQ